MEHFDRRPTAELRTNPYSPVLKGELSARFEPRFPSSPWRRCRNWPMPENAGRSGADRVTSRGDARLSPANSAFSQQICRQTSRTGFQDQSPFPHRYEAMARREKPEHVEASIRSKSDRRSATDRRRTTRQGRRASDPQPRCPSCGLLAPAPHPTTADCVKALRAELERLIAGAPVDPDR